MLKKFIPLDGEVDPSHTPYSIRTFKSPAYEDIQRLTYADPCSYGAPLQPCMLGQDPVSKPMTTEEAIFRLFKIPLQPRFQTFCKKRCKDLDPYVACVMQQKPPNALKHHSVVREKYLKTYADMKRRVHDAQEPSSDETSLIKIDSLIITDGRVQPKSASPACSLETFYVPSRRLAKKRRGRNTLTFYEKIAVIRHYEANQLSRNSLARMFQCCTTQIRRILEQKDDLLHLWEGMSEKDASVIVQEIARKRREFEMKAIAFILHQWVERCRHLQLNMVINNETLKMIAIKMATVLNISDFRPSSRWIEKFRQKFKYKDDNLANPRCAEDPAGAQSVEDIIIEYKQYLPSFMQHEISTITSSNYLQDSDEFVTSNLKEEDEQFPQLVNNATSVTDIEESDGDVNIYEYSVRDPSQNQMATEDVLQYLSAIQEFAHMNSDYQAMSMIRQIEDHFKENYKLQTPDDGDDIILVE